MRRRTALLVMVFGSWLSSFGAKRPEVYDPTNRGDVPAVGSDEGDQAGHDLHSSTVGDVPDFHYHDIDRG